MCACRPLPVSLGWQGKGVNMSYGQEAHMFSAVSMSWRGATVPLKEARPCPHHGQRPCFSPQGQEVVWRVLVLGSLCWWSSTTRWWTTTSWSWPGSSTWTPICCTAHAGMCFSLFTCEATKQFRSNATLPPLPDRSRKPWGPWICRFYGPSYLDSRSFSPTFFTELSVCRRAQLWQDSS